MTHAYLQRKKRERNWSRNTFRNCFWDHYLERTGQLLANVVTSPVTVQKSLRKLTRLLVSKVGNFAVKLITRTRKMVKNNEDDRKKLSTPVMQVNYVDYG